MRTILTTACLVCFVLETSGEQIGFDERNAFSFVYNDVLRDNTATRVRRRLAGEVCLTFHTFIDAKNAIAQLTSETNLLAGYTHQERWGGWHLFEAPRTERLLQVQCPRRHEDLMKALRELPEIRHVSPVLLDQYSLLKMMPLFTYVASLEEDANPANVFGDRPYTVRWPGSSIYELSAEGSSWQQMRRELNTLGLDPRVSWIEPSFIAEAHGARTSTTSFAVLRRPAQPCLPAQVQLTFQKGSGEITLTVQNVANRFITIQQLQDGSWTELTTRIGGSDEEFILPMDTSTEAAFFRALAY